MNRRFDGKVVLVTGASRGLGSDIAAALGREGGRVAVGYHQRADLADNVVAAIVGAGGEACAVQVDVRDVASVERAVAQVGDRLGAIDVVVNNAAVTRDAYLSLSGEGDFEDVVATNLTGAYHVTRVAARGMMARRRGVIVNVASISALAAVPGQVAYAASKAGLIAMTKTLGAELAPRGIRVNAVVPGLLATGMGARLDRRIVERRLEQIPVRRLGTGDEVAAAVLYLASDEASYVIGHALVVDGGLTL